jgi:hypothetical protein
LNRILGPTFAAGKCFVRLIVDITWEDGGHSNV